MIGSVLNSRYRLDAELGRGGMGIVYRARDLLLDRDVAAKVLSAGLLGTEGRSRLLREARAAAQLNHPNIVSVHDAGEALLPGVQDPVPFIIMELVAGPSLRDSPPRSVPETLRLAADICAALEHAHARGVVHRDLKPENVLLAQGQEGTSAKLNDFGLARSMASRLTTEGTIVGTVFYLAPELALGHKYDGRADLYALGVMLYEWATGELPFAGGDALAVISQHLHAPPVPPRARNAAIPASLDGLILRLLSKTPEERPTSAAQVGRLLRRLASGEALPAEFSAEPRGLSLLDRIARGRLVARERELIHVRAAWQRAASGEGQVLLVSGEPGVGKSRLVRELVTQVQVVGQQALVGECYAEGGAPYAPFSQIVHAALAAAGGDGLGLPDFVLADLVALAPALRPAFPGLPANPVLDPQSEQQRLFESLVALCAGLCSRGPLLLVLEDGHWADSGSLALLRHLARRTRRHPVLVVITYREVELAETRPLWELLVDLNRERLATHLKLSRLDREGTRLLLAALFAEETTPEFLDGIYRVTEGNPFFVEEVCKALVESGSLTFDGGRWDRPSMDRLEVPQSVRLAIQSRLGRLPEQLRHVLHVAAILGREFPFDLLVEAMGRAGVGEEAVVEAVESAARARLVEELGGTREVRFAFVHALVAATLADEVPTLRRRRLHRHAAEAIERLHPGDDEALAHHYAEAGDDERALLYSTRAGDRAAAAYSNAEAERHYRAALELAGEGPARVELLAKLGAVQGALSRFEEALATWRQGIRLYTAAGDRDGVATLYAQSARALWAKGDIPGGLAVCREGMAAVARMAPETTPSVGTARLLHETARACHFNDLPEEAAPLARQASELAEQLGAADLQAEALTTLAILPGLEHREAFALLERAVELAERAGLLFQAFRAENNLGTLLMDKLADLASARAHFLRAAELTHRMGCLAHELFSRVNAVGVTLVQGDLATAEQEIHDLRPLAAAIPEPNIAALTLAGTEGELMRYSGRLEELTLLLETRHAELASGGDAAERANTAALLAEIQLERGNVPEAEAAAGEALELVRGIPRPQVALASRLSLWYASRGQTEPARSLLALAREQAAALPTNPFDAAFLVRAEAHLAAAERRWPAAMAAFEGLVAECARLGVRWFEAWIALEWVGALRARGEPEDRRQALSLLAHAAAEFDAIGAPYYARRAREQRQELA